MQKAYKIEKMFGENVSASQDSCVFKVSGKHILNFGNSEEAKFQGGFLYTCYCTSTAASSSHESAQLMKKI